MHKLLSVAVFAGTMWVSTQEKKIIPDAKETALDGLYTVLSGEKDGQPIPEERIKGSVVRFAGNKIVSTDKDKKEFFAATFTLDKGTTPWVIKMKSTTPKEAEATGLVKREGETLTIVYALPGEPAPTEFRARDKQHLFVLKTMPPDGKK